MEEEIKKFVNYKQRATDNFNYLFILCRQKIKLLCVMFKENIYNNERFKQDLVGNF
jgi:hypothetical protein